jgi:hypothetical protein
MHAAVRGLACCLASPVPLSWQRRQGSGRRAPAQPGTCARTKHQEGLWMDWWRFCRSVEASRRSHEGGQQRQTSAVQSDNGRLLRGSGGKTRVCSVLCARALLRLCSRWDPLLPLPQEERSVCTTHTKCMRSLPPALLHWLLQVGGRQTEKTTGVAVGRPTAARGHALQPYAWLLLAVTAFRDGDRRPARERLAGLMHAFPHTRLCTTN